MGFDELKGQTKAVELLKAGYRTGRIAHAICYTDQPAWESSAALIFLACTTVKTPVIIMNRVRAVSLPQDQKRQSP